MTHQNMSLEDDKFTRFNNISTNFVKIIKLMWIHRRKKSKRKKFFTFYPKLSFAIYVNLMNTKDIFKIIL